jgi:exopolysaccharide biosynthesis protein
MIVVSALVVLVTACSSGTPRPTPPRPDSVYAAQIASSITHQFHWYAAGPWAVHTLTIDPRTCAAGFRTVKAQNRVVGRETTSDMFRRVALTSATTIFAAVNADFFSFEPPGISEGPQISGGGLLKSEGSHREAIEDRLLRLQPVFAFTRDGKPIIAHTRMRGEVHAGSLALPLAGVNVRTRADSAFVFTPFYGDTTPTDSAALELIAEDGIIVRIDSSAAGVRIPARGFVVAVRGATRDRIRTARTGDAIRWDARFDGMSNVAEMVGGYPMLLLDGKHVHHNEPGLRSTFADRRHPRAAIARDKQGRVSIVVVDGRREGYSEGMTLQELGAYLLAHGAVDALNLDGGGSTTLVIRGQIVNRPTDANGERPVANALLVVEGWPNSCSGKR